MAKRSVACFALNCASTLVLFWYCSKAAALYVGPTLACLISYGAVGGAANGMRKAVGGGTGMFTPRAWLNCVARDALAVSRAVLSASSFAFFRVLFLLVFDCSTSEELLLFLLFLSPLSRRSGKVQLES